mmetsp:Transcript_17992/g.28154  ORF Transcript_17992/g.28154 Transcript_17992/m.28154 type:complete len:203 (+) Transcript_17992:246-854(+)
MTVPESEFRETERHCRDSGRFTSDILPRNTFSERSSDSSTGGKLSRSSVPENRLPAKEISLDACGRYSNGTSPDMRFLSTVKLLSTPGRLVKFADPNKRLPFTLTETTVDGSHSNASVPQIPISHHKISVTSALGESVASPAHSVISSELLVMISLFEIRSMKSSIRVCWDMDDLSTRPRDGSMLMTKRAERILRVMSMEDN